MRTKILLASAAALVAGMVGANAQVYSANIVGYVNQTQSLNHKFVMVANPLDASNTGGNTLSNLFPGINGGTSIQIWNGSGFDIYGFSGGNWTATSYGSTNANGFIINPGTGFFLNLGGSKAYTNTWLGQVVGTTGASVTNLIMPGFQLVSSLIPYADSVTNTATLNLIVKGGTQLQQWDPVAQGFVIYGFSGGAWSPGNTFSNAPTPTVPFIHIAEGFFFKPNGTSSNVWVEVNP